MKSFFVSLLFFCLPAGAVLAQGAYNKIEKAADGLYFMYYDSCIEKSTIVEFRDHVALLEVSSVYDGGESPRTEHYEHGQKVLRTLDAYFPGKPLRYVLHSHYHPHSLSSVKPFLERNIKVYTTRLNYEKLKDFIDSNSAAAGRNIRFIEGDSLVLKDKTNCIVAYRISRKDYPHLPTKDYVFFHLPKYRALYTGCMYFNSYSRFKSKPVVSGRTEDVIAFCARKPLPLALLIGNDSERNHRELVPYDSLQQLAENGVFLEREMRQLLDHPVDYFRTHQSEVCRSIVASGISPRVLNSLVYAALANKQLDRALELARLQGLLNPWDANAWDTMGEVCQVMGDETMAAFYEKLLQAKGNAGGGRAAWEKSRQRYLEEWAEQGL